MQSPLHLPTGLFSVRSGRLLALGLTLRPPDAQLGQKRATGVRMGNKTINKQQYKNKLFRVLTAVRLPLPHPVSRIKFLKHGSDHTALVCPHCPKGQAGPFTRPTLCRSPHRPCLLPVLSQQQPLCFHHMCSLTRVPVPCEFRVPVLSTATPAGPLL